MERGKLFWLIAVRKKKIQCLETLKINFGFGLRLRDYNDQWSRYITESYEGRSSGVIKIEIHILAILWGSLTVHHTIFRLFAPGQKKIT